MKYYFNLNRFTPSAGAFHRIIQILFLMCIVWIGWRFYLHVEWAMGHSDSYVPKPSAVEGFLPISAMLAAKKFLFLGNWDTIHPAGLVIFFFALLSALFLRKAFCGYICPVGTLCNILFRLGRHLKLTLHIPPLIMRILSIPKYLLLYFFLRMVLPGGMEMADIEAFLSSPYNMVADTKLLLFFMSPSVALCVALTLILFASIFVPSFWCRCLCPYGALQGIISLFSPLAIRRNEEKCIACGRCSSACPQGILVEQKKRICSCECTGCQECVGACPKKDCLTIQLGFSERKNLRLPWYMLGSAAVGLWLALYVWAVATEHWTSELPQEMIRILHTNMMNILH